MLKYGGGWFNKELEDLVNKTKRKKGFIRMGKWGSDFNIWEDFFGSRL